MHSRHEKGDHGLRGTSYSGVLTVSGVSSFSIVYIVSRLRADFFVKFPTASCTDTLDINTALANHSCLATTFHTKDYQ